MKKKSKKASVLLLFMSLYVGAGHAVVLPRVTDVEVMQQNGRCIGVVKDAAGETIIGASVIVKGTSNGIITDINGDFSLMNVKKGEVIRVSFVGYVTQDIKWDGNPVIVVLKDDTQALDEIVVTGYGGSQKRGTLTTAISKVDDGVLKDAAFSNAGQALQGSVTGLRVVNTTG